MINLDIERYCENCPDFEPNVDKETLRVEDFGSYYPEPFRHETVITCKYRDRCHEIYERAKDECKKENKNG